MSSPQYTIQAYTSPADFVAACAPALLATRAVSANLPLASSIRLAKNPADIGPQDIWLSLTSAAEDVIYTLAVVSTFPCVLACSHDPSTLPTEAVASAMAEFARAVQEKVPNPSRLTAVLGPRAIADPFVEAWTTLNGLKRREKPFFHIYLSYIERGKVLDPVRSAEEGFTCRRAEMSDLDQATKLSFDFAALGAHPMSEEAARARTKMIIESEDLYVCARTSDGTLFAISSLMRPTPGVKAISMVYTVPEARGKGLAEAIVRAACEGGFAQGFDKICLNVEPTNPGAARVYGRVGFVGLKTGIPGPETEEWIEQGWEGAVIEPDWRG